MKRLSICLAIVGALIYSSCVVTEVDHTVDLTRYRTFGWGKSTLDTENPAYKSEMIKSSIKASIKEELAHKGISYKTKKPDLLVSYEGYTENQEKISNGGRYYSYYPSYFPYYYPYYAPRYYWYGSLWSDPILWGGPVYLSNPPIYDSTVRGTLVLTLRDRKTNKLVWRGTVEGDVANAKVLKKNIAKGVKAILKKYPTVSHTLMSIHNGKVS